MSVSVFLCVAPTGDPISMQAGSYRFDADRTDAIKNMRHG